MDIIELVLLVLGFVCFVVAAVGPAGWGRPALVPTGLAAWILVEIIETGQRMHGAG
jgi:hypothetical protein